MDKSPDAFRTISEVADVLETPAHVLRFWESRFPQIKPVKRAGGRRYYRPSDVALLAGIKRLLHDEGLTIRGVQKILRDQGARHVAGLSDETIDLADLVAGSDAFDEDALQAALEADADEVPAPDPGPLSLTEAFGAFDDPEDDSPIELAPTSLAPGDQPDLPLFPAAPARRAPDQPRQRRQTEANLASLIRNAPPGALSDAEPELRLLAGRLARHRDLVAERALGSQT